MNIGIALVTNPRVLFLDEPTSGLDSYTSNEVMTVVKTLTKTGITICATIHNPTPYCFNLFDRLMILLHGRVVYSGENGVQRGSAPVLLQRAWACLLCLCMQAVLSLPASASLRALTCSLPAGPAAVRYFEQFPEVTPFGQRGSFHNKVPPAFVGPSVAGVSGIQRGCCICWSSLSSSLCGLWSRAPPCVCCRRSGSWTSRRARTGRASTPTMPTATTAATSRWPT